MPAIQNIGRAEYENASISIPPIGPELRAIEIALSKTCKDWQELSEREKRGRVHDRYDEIACGALGKWESLESELGTVDGAKLGNHFDHLSPETVWKSNGDKDVVGKGKEKESPAQESLDDRGRSSMRSDAPSSLKLPKPGSSETRAPSFSTPRSSPARQRYPQRSAQRSSSLATQGRSRAHSNTSSTTLSRQPTQLALRSPSLAAVTSSIGLLSAGPVDRRVASSSASSVTALERAQVQTGGASTALASLLATQAKLMGKAKLTATIMSPEKSGGWFWNRKAKAAHSPSRVMNASPTAGGSAYVYPESGTEVSTSLVRTSKEASPPAPHPGKSSPSSMGQPVTSLSLPPATPAAVNTTTAEPSSLPTLSQLRPVAITSTPAAFQVATNDLLPDTHSLEEHSVHQYYLDAVRHTGAHTKRMQGKIDAARADRLERLNPSNPSRSSGMLQDQSRRWTNIFPRARRINNQRSVKWKSLCTPACLPLYSDYMPTHEELITSYTKETHTLLVKPGMSSFVLLPGKDVTEIAGNLLRELVSQRLAQSFQIIMPPYDDVRRPKARYNSSSSADTIVLPSARDIREILYNTPEGEGKSIYLGISNVVHGLHFDRKRSSVVTTTWRKIEGWSRNPYKYSFVLWPVGARSFTSRTITFAYPDIAAYDWEYTDRLVAGMEEPKLHEKTKYWRTRFLLVPAAVPDLQGMLKSQAKLLLEDSTEEDLRIAGVMTLFEQFSKARWMPNTKDQAKLKSEPL